MVMAIVDEEDVHVVRAQPPESEEEGDDVGETLVSDSEGIFVDPDADEAVPVEQAAPAAKESWPEAPAAPAAGSTAPATPATPAAAPAAEAVVTAAPAGHAPALSNGHVAVRQQQAAAPPAVVVQQAVIVSQAALCWSDTVRLPVVCSVTGKALQIYND